MWKGSGVRPDGRSALRKAASAMAPWAVMAARARFSDSCSIASRWSADRNSIEAPAPTAATCGGGVWGAAAASGFGAASGLAALAVGLDFAGDGLAALGCGALVW